MRVTLCLMVLVVIGANSSIAATSTPAAATSTPAPVEVTGQMRCWNPSDMIAIPTPNKPKEIDCSDPAAAGQDGAVRAGVPFPSPRFTATADQNGDGDCTDDGETCDGTVRDNLTGLVWLQHANCFGTKTWAEALTLPNSLEDLADNTRDCGLRDKSGKGDWRLPNIKELQSLVNFGFSDPALSNAAGTSHCIDGIDCAFSNLGSGRTYWSSTTFLVPLTDTEMLTNSEALTESVVNKAWSVDMGNGNTLPHFRWHSAKDTPTTFSIWPVKGPVSGIEHARVEVTGQQTCWAPIEMSNTPRPIDCSDPAAAGQDGVVRAGVPFPSPRFTANVDRNGDGDCTDDGETCDGTVRDNLTGLVWLQHANCFGTKTWAEALDVANNLQDAADRDCGLSDKSGKGDWRLPNVKELQSLIDFGTADQSIFAFPLKHPFRDMRPRYYWSSTTSMSGPDDAWTVSLVTGITLPIGNNNAPGIVVKCERRGVWLVRGGTVNTRTHFRTDQYQERDLPLCHRSNIPFVVVMQEQ